MDTVFEKFNELWQKALLEPNDKTNVNSQFFHKARIDSVLFQDMNDFLKDEFYNSKTNVFNSHLYLIEKALKEKECSFKFARAAFINQAFAEFYNQLKNLCKRGTTDPKTQEAINHFTINCEKTFENVHKAFELSVSRNISMLSSFNKIYCFSQHLDELNPTLMHYAKKINFTDQATLIGELQVHKKFEMKQIVIPLMLIDKYPSIDEYINKNEAVLLEVVELCDTLCNPTMNLKEMALSYENVQRKKVDKFKSKIIAKYASGCLKRVKKLYLITIKFANIAIQLKISQMRFLINLRYDKWGGDPISFEAWSELILDLIGDDEILQNKLLIELIQYQKDVEIAHKFLDIFGFEKNFNKLPDSLKEFYLKNIDIIQAENLKKKKNGELDDPITKLYYYPTELLNESNIRFVDSAKTFEDMLEYFEKSKPEIIGLDCEWKPSFDLIDSSNENSKKNHASTLQIATRECAFVIDIKFLIETLSQETINKFGDLVLFNENVKKYGYSFQQDAKKLSMSFPTFSHKFSEFEEDVINIDEVVTEFQKNWNLFPHLTDEIKPKDKRSRQSKGLSELTRKCFGASLNKSECLSNWDKRPLRMAQLKYGALDSFVLIQIHDYIQARCKELDINFDYSSKKNYF